jgi:hypothetical protein
MQLQTLARTLPVAEGMKKDSKKGGGNSKPEEFRDLLSCKMETPVWRRL